MYVFLIVHKYRYLISFFSKTIVAVRFGVHKYFKILAEFAWLIWNSTSSVRRTDKREFLKIWEYVGFFLFTEMKPRAVCLIFNKPANVLRGHVEHCPNEKTCRIFQVHG